MSTNQNQNQEQPSKLDDLRGTVKVCLRCGHQWASRIIDGPKACTRCKSYRWMEPKRPAGTSSRKAGGKARRKAPTKPKVIMEPIIEPIREVVVGRPMGRPPDEPRRVQIRNANGASDDSVIGMVCFHAEVGKDERGVERCKGCGVRVEG